MNAPPTLDGNNPPDLRSIERFDCEVQTTCQPPSAWAKDPWPATIRNISAGGMCLTLQRRFEPGSGLAIELPADDGTSSTVLARVAHVRPLEAGVWIMGVNLISELSDEEIGQVLNLSTMHRAALEDSAGAQPVTSRSGVLFDVRYPTDAGDRRIRWFVKRLDHSGQWPIPPDRVLTFRFEHGSLKMTTLQCSPYGPYWLIKSWISAEPTADILAALEKVPSA